MPYKKSRILLLLLLTGCGLPKPVYDMSDPRVITIEEDMKKCEFWVEKGGYDVAKTTAGYIGGGAAFGTLATAAALGSGGIQSGEGGILILAITAMFGIVGYALENENDIALYKKCVLKNHYVHGWK